jgi:hypothetical protein
MTAESRTCGQVCSGRSSTPQPPPVSLRLRIPIWDSDTRAIEQRGQQTRTADPQIVVGPEGVRLQMPDEEDAAA